MRSAHGCCSAQRFPTACYGERRAVGCSSRVSLSPPCRAKLSEVGSASWLASQSALPAAHIICARTWGETTRSQYTVPRKLRPPLDMAHPGAAPAGGDLRK